MTKRESRKAKVLEVLSEQPEVTVEDASKLLHVSDATVRRLFSELQEAGKIIRTHGGARLIPDLGTAYSYAVSATRRKNEKKAVGRGAAGMVNSGDRLFLDSGSTVFRFAESLHDRLKAGELTDIHVITNSVILIELLAEVCRVLLLGGEFRPERRDVCGPVTEKTLFDYHVDKAFFGADAVNSRGLMTTDSRTARIVEIVLERSGQAFVLADSEKFGRFSYVRYGGLGDVTGIITDAGFSEEDAERYNAAGANIIRVLE
jgi:DeoR/GlpR family transcriptional regulator of sugar metabolism